MTAPFLIRLVKGDITRVQSSMLVVSHFNGVNPVGAQAAVDQAMGGAITRRAASGAINGRFASTHFLPAATSSLAAGSVLVVGLGDPERFVLDRLPEVGAAIVDAVATFRLRDAATTLHSTGSTGIDHERAARLLVGGVLEALRSLPGAGCFRELVIVERDATKLAKIERGLRAAASAPDLHVYVDHDEVPSPPLPVTSATADTMLPDHLRIGVTRAGTKLKVTIIGHSAFDCAADIDYPAKVADTLVKDVSACVLREEDPDKRAEVLRSVGYRLNEIFLSWTPFEVAKLIEEAPGGLVVLRLDQWTVDLPWEMLFANEKFVTHTRLMARQLESSLPARQNAFVEPHDVLRVLVVGDPTDDLPASRQEAEVVAGALADHPGAEVTALVGNVRYEDVSRELNTVSYDVLHYAGHARFDPLQPGASGLALADHSLTADDLSSRRFLPRLVFANACNSAQTGDAAVPDLFKGSEPTRNFVSGLLAAGVRAFIGSAWKVEDQTARTFATAFYDAVLNGNGPAGPSVSIGKAMQDARLQVVDRHGEGQHGWAGYTLYGSPWKSAL